MWLSERAARNEDRETGGAVGVVTIEGAHSAVELESETRGVPVVLPGGLAWLPVKDQEVLTLRCEHGDLVILGVLERELPAGMEPGEVCLFTQNASVRIKTNGEITLTGNVRVEGSLTVNGVTLGTGGGNGTETG